MKILPYPTTAFIAILPRNSEPICHPFHACLPRRSEPFFHQFRCNFTKKIESIFCQIYGHIGNKFTSFYHPIRSFFVTKFIATITTVTLSNKTCISLDIQSSISFSSRRIVRCYSHWDFIQVFNASNDNH